LKWLNKRTEVGGQKPEDGGWKPEDRGQPRQKAEIGKAEIERPKQKFVK
jgi:hypothetical protein